MLNEQIKVAVCSTVHQHDDSRVYHRQTLTLSEHFGTTLYICAPFAKKEVNERLQVIGLPQWQRKTDRIKNYLLMIKSLFESNATVFIFHDPELLLLIPFVKLFKRGKTIYDIHESYHNLILEKEWIPKFFRKAMANLYNATEWLVFKFTDMIWYPHMGVGVHYEKYKNLGKLIVGNVPQLEKFQSVSRNGKQPMDRIVLISSLEEDRGLVPIVNGFHLFQKKIPHFRLLLAGPFTTTRFENEIRDLVASLGLEKQVDIPGKLPYEQVPQILSDSKIGLLLHQPTGNYLTSIPIKLFEYMSMELPVIGSDFNTIQEILKTSESGICVDPQNPQEIADAMTYLAEHEDIRKTMGKNGAKVVAEKYNWGIEAENLIKSIKGLF